MAEQGMIRQSNNFLLPIKMIFQQIGVAVGWGEVKRRTRLTLWIDWAPFFSYREFNDVFQLVERRLSTKMTESQDVGNSLPTPHDENELESACLPVRQVPLTTSDYILNEEEFAAWQKRLPGELLNRYTTVFMLDAISLGRETFWSILRKLPKGRKSVPTVLHLLSIEASEHSPERVAQNLCRLMNGWKGLLIIDLNGADMTFRFRRRLLGSLVRFRMLSLSKYKELELEGAFTPPILAF